MEDLTTDSLGGANIGSLLDHLAYDKTDGGGGDDFADMPRIMIGHHLGRGCSFSILIQFGFQNQGW